ncbi:zinc finger protein 646 isoform X1 [Sphaeramia orbicularis]|uniref:Zinc finger protein 646-like n=1 Tax=Sphaeramia orbicularis TaxID=375764 RepID=A0A673C9I8_9TELE|nr:zinc finger protein 646-like isoform X1 [Sphaeramia orbicularis]XP_029977870.1 zinc finger protein 646-like isoform X1 [Sphaeramia orbicularis]XP_029977871.1 zinc finger protein 646-like isoform X1 [Sphaeramia orbicularis]XP_029977872.1 zinc finger protein 646-like isoform X1 [Sphaeramia orbicularis]XP_029977873.1 zinc finger protein 646-like isoform X1 [Sphaeramia orbicularis]
MAVQDLGRATGFACKQCGLIYPNMPSLLDHMDAHLEQEEDRKFKCDECGRGYRHAGSLANHKKTHDVGSFQCNICGKENSNALALKSHLRSHTSQKKYSCSDCGKAFRLASQLMTHERVHQVKRAKEDLCRKADVEGAENENQHEVESKQLHHFHEQSPSVGTSTNNSSDEDKTEEVYNAQSETDDSANRPFRCNICGKSYIHLRSLTNHKKTHQTGMFECTVCFKLFNNMAALYSHQRSHKSKSRTEPDSVDEPYMDTSADQFSPQSQDAPVNFCHLCQVLFPNDKEFQEHIQMHNSSSMSFGLQDSLPENHNLSYDNSIASPQSNFYVSPMSNIPSASSIDNHGAYDLPAEQITNNGHIYSNCSNNQTSSSNSTQGEPPVITANILSPALVHTQNSNNTSEMEETSTGDSDERPFKCQICYKSYRHSGSLINHKRSHQVGIYQCSICRKSYPHLAALKSHLRLHKGQPASFSLNSEGDWLSSEPLTVENQHGCYSQEEEEVDDGHPALVNEQENGLDHSNGALYHEQYNQEFSQDMTVQLPHNDHLMQRHMCADCGETFADIAGIKSHSCPRLQQQHDTTNSDYDSNAHFQDSNGHCAAGNSGSSVEFHGMNGSHDYYEQNFHENLSRDHMTSSGAGDDTEEEDDDEDDDGDLYHCSICGNSYTSMRALRSHLRGHTQSHGTPASSGPSSMSSHEEMKDDEPGEMMICSTCGESFVNTQDLISHQLLHSTDQGDNRLQINNSDSSRGKEEAQSVICGSCGIFCTSFHHLTNHGCSAERKNEPTKCEKETEVNEDTCREDTSVVKDTVDTEERQYQCEQCGRSYRHAGSLLNHKKSHKTGVFRCLVCQKRFYNLLALKNHQRSHFDIKRYTCHECGKAFKIQKQLLNHLRRHKENQAKIRELNNQIQALMRMNGTRSDGGMQSLTTNASQAFTHKQRPREKTGETKREPSVKSENTDDQRPFACDQCGRTYRHAGSLVNHRNSHKTGQYYCSVCNNTYSNQLAMKNHLRTHFAFKKHSCQKCGKGFRGKKQLLSHVCAGFRKDGSDGRRGLKSRAFKCKECKQAFPSHDQLTAHTCEGPSASDDAQTSMSPNDKEERPFRCNICNRSYRHAGSLLNHKNTHKTGHFSCTVCSKPFTNPMALRNHTRIHTQKKKYVCLTCGKAFRLASILHNHQKVHNRVAGHFSCPGCGKSFQGKSGLRRHRCRRSQENSTRAGVQQSDRGDKCFMCDLCGRSYRHAGSLLNHKKTHSENLHHCTLCLQTFPDPLTLQIHSQMRRHCCPECGKTFCLVSHLQSHMEVHSKDQSVVCDICQQSFPNTATYQQHRDMHPMAQGPVDNNLCWDSGINQTLGMGKQEPPPLSHIPQKNTNMAGTEDKGHVCEHCGRTYRHAGSLLNHKNSHKTGSFFCSVCQKEFTNLMALKNHRRIHTEPKRYQCLECGKAFRVSTQLICHRRIHTKEKPFACLLCDKSFSSKSNLRHHQKMHQNTQTYDSSFSMDANTFMDLDMGSFL